MNVQQLEAFLEVASKRSFGRAARSLFITQPTLSARIKALEAELGQDLFVRPKGGVRLTERGTRFLPFAERALDLLREGSRAVTEATSASSGRLRLAATPSCSSYIVPPILKAFHERHPNVALELNSAHTADVLEMVLSRTVQLGFARALKHSRLEMLDL
jgi:DNA-binding transcriptional LysR family regulator